MIAELKREHFTRERIAAECDCSQATISDLANGVTADPKHTLGERIRELHRQNVILKRAKRKARA